MHHHKSCILAAGLYSALAVKAAPHLYTRQEASLPAVQANTLVDLVDEAYLRTGAETLQRIADEHNGTRAFGTPGHFAGLEWIESQLNETDAYDVQRQYFEAYQYTPLANTTFVVDGQPALNFSTPEFSPNGTASGNIIYSGLGCEASSFPANVTGQIALVDRGTCEFGLKASLAAAAGATGAIIADNVQATADLPPSSVTLGEPTRPEGPYVPIVAVSYNYGQQLQNSSATAVITVTSKTELTSTYNILAETRGGDKDNVITVGAHTDSVLAGPGINDDGSGTVAILHIALALVNYTTTPAVRFGFWSAEEAGLLGSSAFVASLNQSEVAKIRMNLNFDMLASPNGVYMIYDGDGSTYNLTGPDGSAQIETVFESYYTSANLSFRATEFDGRSDYGPFLDIGIPCGGLFSGAEEVKTEEEAAIWGGTAGVAYDVNYHKAGDDINNLNYRDWVVNTKAAAFAVGTYAASLEGFPAQNATAVVPNRKRDLAKRAGHTHAGTNHHGGCGPKAIE